ncbi:streptophobe family protein [Streptomyces poriticola]|uniref:streptophobe family protein n=1 Tax=Streptomyces poriticola TaxID=3120506 RepID=UPI002FCE3F2F
MSVSMSVGSGEYARRVPWADVLLSAIASVSWALIGMASTAAFGLHLLGADAAGSLGPMTAAVVALAAGGSVTPSGDVSAFGLDHAEAHTAIDITPLGVSLAGALLLSFFFLRSLRTAGVVVSAAELLARAGAVVALFLAMLGGLAWVGHDVITIDGGSLGVDELPDGGGGVEIPGLGDVGGIGDIGDIGGLLPERIADLVDAEAAVGFTVATGPTLLGGFAWSAGVLLIALLASRRTPLPYGWDAVHRVVRPAVSAVVTALMAAVAAGFAAAAYAAIGDDHPRRIAGAALLGAPNGVWVGVPIGLFVPWDGQATGALARLLPDPLDELLSVRAGEPVTLERLAELDGRVWLLGVAAALLMLLAGVLTAARTPVSGGTARTHGHGAGRRETAGGRDGTGAPGASVGSGAGGAVGSDGGGADGVGGLPGAPGVPGAGLPRAGAPGADSAGADSAGAGAPWAAGPETQAPGRGAPRPGATGNAPPPHGNQPGTGVPGAHGAQGPGAGGPGAGMPGVPRAGAPGADSAGAGAPWAAGPETRAPGRGAPRPGATGNTPPPHGNQPGTGVPGAAGGRGGSGAGPGAAEDRGAVGDGRAGGPLRFAGVCGVRLGVVAAVALGLLAWLTRVSVDASLSVLGFDAFGAGIGLHGNVGMALALGAAWGTGAGATGALLARATGAAGRRAAPLARGAGAAGTAGAAASERGMPFAGAPGPYAPAVPYRPPDPDTNPYLRVPEELREPEDRPAGGGDVYGAPTVAGPVLPPRGPRRPPGPGKGSGRGSGGRGPVRWGEGPPPPPPPPPAPPRRQPGDGR